MKASDNEFPSVLLGEGAAPANPPAGSQRLFVDSADHKVKRVDSSGTVTGLEGGGVTSFNTRTGAVSLVKADVTGTGLAAADVGAAPTSSAYSLPSTQQAGTAYTLAVADRGKVLEFTAATAVTVTIPPASTADLGADAVVNLYQAGAGQVTITAGAGVTLRAPDGAKTAKQYAEVSLRRRGTTDEWVLSGNVST